MKILITGGSGTIGKSFIKKYYDDYEFISISRNENQQTELIREFPRVKSYTLNVEDFSSLYNVYRKVKPDAVIHTAAMKHVNLAEENPYQACSINVVGSMNVIESSLKTDVPVTVGVSTDKACSPKNVYGYTKSLMESCLVDANSDDISFACCRFANVTHSNGSVLPFWLDLKSQGKPLKLTDPNMNRLMFSQETACELIHDTMIRCNTAGGFVSSYKMKTVNMLELANEISDNIEIMGKRPGEKTNETLISKDEIDFTEIDGKMMRISTKINEGENRLKDEYSTLTAEKMTPAEIRELIWI